MIECGPGDGTLHRRVLQALGFRRRWGLRTHLVERSPVLRAQQQAVLKGWPRPQWHTGMGEALTACGGEALIFSNELADAFPATLLQWTGSAWQEVWLELNAQGGIVEALRDLLEPVESTACALPWPQGQRIEVLESYRHWLNDWRAAWRSGAMLTIDYGGTAEEIYHRRPGGTARGFLRHQRLDATQLYAAMGRCDVTVDVNFPDLIAWGQAAGLETVACMTQREFSGSSDAGPEEDAFQCLIQRPL